VVIDGGISTSKLKNAYHLTWDKDPDETMGLKRTAAANTSKSKIKVRVSLGVSFRVQCNDVVSPRQTDIHGDGHVPLYVAMMPRRSLELKTRDRTSDMEDQRLEEINWPSNVEGTCVGALREGR
jgi:hypothetical protein